MFQKPGVGGQYEDPNLSGSSNEVETVVGQSVQVEGDFSSEGNILIKGIVSGSVRTSRLLTVESGAKIFANVKAGNAIISGEVKGNVKTEDKLELTSSARVMGDIDCKVFVVEAGALIVGKISMKGIEGDDAKSDKKSFVGRIKSAKIIEKNEQTEEGQM